MVKESGNEKNTYIVFTVDHVGVEVTVS